jgi:hypothetical protein
LSGSVVTVLRPDKEVEGTFHPGSPLSEVDPQKRL